MLHFVLFNAEIISNFIIERNERLFTLSAVRGSPMRLRDSMVANMANRVLNKLNVMYTPRT